MPWNNRGKLRWQEFCSSITTIFVPWIEQCHVVSSFLGFPLGCRLAQQLHWGVMLWEEGCGAAAAQGSWGWKGLCRSSGSASFFKEIWLQNKLTLLRNLFNHIFAVSQMEIAQHFWATCPALKTLAWQDFFPLYPTGISLAATHDCCLLSLCCVLYLYTSLLRLLINKIHFLRQKWNFLYRILEVSHRNIGGK